MLCLGESHVRVAPVAAECSVLEQEAEPGHRDQASRCDGGGPAVWWGIVSAVVGAVPGLPAVVATTTNPPSHPPTHTYNTPAPHNAVRPGDTITRKLAADT